MPKVTQLMHGRARTGTLAAWLESSLRPVDHIRHHSTNRPHIKTILHLIIYQILLSIYYVPSFLLSTGICSEQNSHGHAHSPCTLGGRAGISKQSEK